MINSKHVPFLLGGPLLLGLIQCISLGDPDPSTPPPPRKSTRLLRIRSYDQWSQGLNQRSDTTHIVFLVNVVMQK